MELKWDGHTHTRFCYHGSDASSEAYIDRAIELGFQRYTLSEHPPLPARWVEEESLYRELAMPREELADYIQYAKRMKRIYEGRIEITVGLELDHLPGRTDYTESLFADWQHELEDVVYSVHYLPGAGGAMRCVDFTPDYFREHLLSYYGTMDKLVEEYYDHVEAAIEWVSRLPVRSRIGHINLIEKFAAVLPEADQALIRRRQERLVPLLVRTGVGVDVNTAGMRVATCGKPYVPEWMIAACRQAGVPCIFGSDAHKPEHVGTGWDWFEQLGKSSR
ncbi:histidinol-phosphatase [Xylanibacillus composti]|uniref:Histidinol-phosphatase n=1 Tax=Xylanibacillus composti TaxID=1572762 RepID=A0A8J4M0M1_9BACL|nr:histidinol-phosphatase HisJ [Xylanibacillus composti]MDT9726783.1 histidinol-phosphatase [Xylanibacillus composti]GIQ67235.1 histidinol-phosphatase [Xylanibacillus composti]